MDHLIKPRSDAGVPVEVTPGSAGWRYLSFKVVALKAGQRLHEATEANEVALVPLSGRGTYEAAGQKHFLERQHVFAGAPPVLYVPPGETITVTASSDLELALGAAPAQGKYPVRLFRPDEMRQELRGGGAARRQVNHILAAPLPAERLILFEVYVPGGAWSGWPPHCHDGSSGSPYLEETYYYRFDPPNGYGIQRNYRRDTDFDEFFAVRHGDLTLVTQGYHPVVATPGSNMYFLNYQAGELEDAARATPPHNDPEYEWIIGNWEKNLLQLPVGGSRA